MDKLKPQANIALVATWFGAAFTCLIFSVLFSFYLSSTKIAKQTSQSFKLYAALPDNSIQISDNVERVDARGKIIENFFERYKSPLAASSNIFVSVSDKYQLDYKLLPAIAMQESNGGKKVITNSFNPFGYGIYGSLVVKFSSWEQAIERVGKALREDYLNEGLDTPQKIMVKYTPPSLASGGSWAKGVSSFIQELK